MLGYNLAVVPSYFDMDGVGLRYRILMGKSIGGTILKSLERLLNRKLYDNLFQNSNSRQERFRRIFFPGSKARSSLKFQCLDKLNPFSSS